MLTWREKQIRRIDEIYDKEEEELLLIYAYLSHKIVRSPSIYRHRCKFVLFFQISHLIGNSDYLINLASKENSFIKEYRLDPSGFDYLVSLLQPALEIDSNMASLAMRRSGSEQISTTSRVGAALIILAGGRVVESMRTHGLAQSTVYQKILYFKHAGSL